MLLSAGITFLSLLSTTYAQDLSVSTSWKKFSNTRLLAERIKVSQDAIDNILPQLNVATGEFNSRRWAQAAISAYRAYEDFDLLVHAIATWNHVTEFVITGAQVNAKTNPRKNFPIADSCEGATMAGGVFWISNRTTSDEQSINSITTGFIDASTFALLAEIIRDAKYKNAAILSAQWIKAHNINSNKIILDSVNSHDCSRSPSTWIFTYNSGKYIEGLSVVSDITGDAQWRGSMLEIIAAAVKSTKWQGADGIITEGASPNDNNDGVGFKSIYLRGLSEAFGRNPSNTNFRILLHKYIDVQYNALLDLAVTGSSYSSRWNGPPQAFTTWVQLTALDILGSAIIANN
ncbi:glycosyl hydrolase family 76-domain-containing protein [Crucibulum laeve]|uniref:Glycosyl hydrolase family 76-domain-containing protein n=1 Tax=Crucibulum laeve TaxID=68775 RepID=A0A5C3M415_9AGAR|nr:glycosyl hydrolase family 76-domain-containing protein [Crucibulum laeve]